MRKVLLTGASRGIGEAIKKKLSADYIVRVPDRDELDLADSDSVQRFIKYGCEFDVLINNAGINIIKPTIDITASDIRLINTINLESPLLLAKACIPYMQKQKRGSIVNISSIWGIRSKEQRALYSSTKFGLIGQTKALARELGEYNILVNAVCPGFTDTELTKSSLNSEQREEMLKSVPLGRFADPSEIANFVAYLISVENSYITGQAILIDGGFTA
jgi:3-oxoacyl-[acyl-carrier protein] reductase